MKFRNYETKNDEFNIADHIRKKLSDIHFEVGYDF